MSTKKKLDFLPKGSEIILEDGDHIIVSSEIEVLDKETTLNVYVPGERQSVKFNIGIPGVEVSVITSTGVITGTSFALRRGKYRYTINHPKYKPIEGEFTVGNEDVNLNIQLELIKYNLTINTVPENCIIELFLNDNWVLSEKTTNLIPGLYRYRVSKEGYITKQNMVTVVSEDVSILVELEEVKQTLRFTTIPDSAKVEVYINNIWTTGKNHSVSPGNYRYRVSLIGYDTIEDNITVTKGVDTTTKNIKLIPSKYELNIIVTPLDANVEVYFNDRWNNGRTFRLPNGTYRYRIQKEGYVSIEDSVIILNENKVIDKILNLFKVILSFNVTPVDCLCELEIDGVYKSGKSHNVVPGNYNWRISKTGYVSKSGNINVSKNNITIQEELELILFNVSVNITPLNGNFRIKDNKNIWHENKRELRLPNGTYEYTASLDGYNNISDTFTVNDEDYTLNINLIKIKYTLQINTTPSDATVEVFIDNSWRVGKTHQLDPGVYRYKVSKNNYSTIEGSIDVNNNKSISINLRENTNEVIVNKTPFNSRFKIQEKPHDGDGYGASTIRLSLPNGTYNWYCEADHYRRQNGSFSLNNNSHNLDINLEAILYNLKLNYFPTDATFKLFINDEERIIPGREIQLPHGTYKYICEKQGYDRITGWVTVNSNDNSVNVQLRKPIPQGNYTLRITTDPPVAKFELDYGETGYITGKEFRVPSGVLFYRLSYDGYMTRTGQIMIKNESRDITMTLYAEKYDLVTSVNPADAIIYLESDYYDSSLDESFDKNKWTGVYNSPQTVKLFPREYKYVCVRDGYETKTGSIVIERNNSNRLSVSLEKKGFLFSVNITPENAPDKRLFLKVKQEYVEQSSLSIGGLKYDDRIDICVIAFGYLPHFTNQIITEDTVLDVNLVPDIYGSKLEIYTTPYNARIEVKINEVLTNVVSNQIENVKTGSKIKIKVSADGYKEYTEEFIFLRSTMRSINLVKINYNLEPITVNESPMLYNIHDEDSAIYKSIHFLALDANHTTGTTLVSFCSKTNNNAPDKYKNKIIMHKLIQNKKFIENGIYELIDKKTKEEYTIDSNLIKDDNLYYSRNFKYTITENGRYFWGIFVKESELEISNEKIFYIGRLDFVSKDFNIVKKFATNIPDRVYPEYGSERVQVKLPIKLHYIFKTQRIYPSMFVEGDRLYITSISTKPSISVTKALLLFKINGSEELKLSRIRHGEESNIFFKPDNDWENPKPKDIFNCRLPGGIPNIYNISYDRFNINKGNEYKLILSNDSSYYDYELEYSVNDDRKSIENSVYSIGDDYKLWSIDSDGYVYKTELDGNTSYDMILVKWKSTTKLHGNPELYRAIKVPYDNTCMLYSSKLNKNEPLYMYIAIAKDDHTIELNQLNINLPSDVFTHDNTVYDIYVYYNNIYLFGSSSNDTKYPLRIFSMK